MSKIATVENYDAIERYYSDDLDTLNTQQLQLFARLDYADNLIRRFGSGAQTAKRLHARMKVDDAGYSLRQAYRDLEFSTMLYGSMSKQSKEMDKMYAAETLKREIQLAKNIKNGHQRSGAVAKLLKELRETLGYHLQDPELPDFSTIGANLIIVTNDPSAAMNIKKYNDDERRELAAKYSVPPSSESEKVEDVDHEEL